MLKKLPSIDIVIPVHNEGASIGDTLQEFYDVVQQRNGITLRFVVCENGSTDNTVEVLKTAHRALPMQLITGAARKTYSRAVVDGLRAASAELVGVMHSDGQCDPNDFPQLVELVAHHDLVIGHRTPRVDSWMRKALSTAFKGVYQLFFAVPVKDPSCPYIIIRRAALEKILEGNAGILQHGFWWEFMARAQSHGLRIAEMPVRQRERAAQTSVFAPVKVPGIAVSHLIGLCKLKRELTAAK